MENYVVLIFAALHLTHGGHYKIGVLVQEEIWTDFSSLSDDTVVNNDVQVNFTVHKFATRNGIQMCAKVCELLGEGYGGFISFVDCPTASVLDLQSSSRHIPHIMLYKNVCNQDKSIYTYHLLPSCSRMNKALADIALSQNYLDIVILHDHTLGSFCLQDLISRFSTVPASSRIINLKRGVRLELAKKQGLKTFVVFTDNRNLNQTLLEADRLKMFKSEYTWIVVTGEITNSSLPSSNMSSGRISFLRQLYPGMINTNGTCVETWPVASQLSTGDALLADAKSVYMKVFKNLESTFPGINLSSFECRQQATVVKHGSSIAAEMQKVSLTGHTGVISWNTDKYPTGSSIQICSTKHNVDTYQHMGTWRDGLNLVNSKLFGNDFSDFGNRTLTIATKPISPFVIFTERNGTIDYSGFCFDILNELACHFKFRYRIVEPPDGMYGGLNSDGTWNGMVGMVMRGEVDFAIGPFTITSIRETVIDFTVPYIEDGVGILTKRPEGEPNKIYKMFKPFSLIVWCCIGAAILVVGIMMCIVGCISPYVDKGLDSTPETVKEQKSLKQTVWLIYGSFLEQSVEPRPSTFSGRSMLGFWWVFTILMTSTYTANLAANLTVSIPEQPINSLEELVSQNQIEPLVKSGTNIHTLFMTSGSGIYNKVWEMMGSMPKVTSNEEALAYVRQGVYAFMTDVTQLDYIVRKECQKYSLADEIFNNAGLGFVLPENAPFKDAFNLNMMKMQEAGMTERWKEEWWPIIDSCSSQSRQSGAKSLGMDSLAGLFYVYIAVAGLSVVVFILDMFYRKCFAEKLETRLKHIKSIICKQSDKKSKLTHLK